MSWLLSWSLPTILGPVPPEALDRFWEAHSDALAPCITEPVDLTVVVGSRCEVLAVRGGPVCLSEVIVGEALSTPYCGCGVTIIEQSLRR